VVTESQFFKVYRNKFTPIYAEVIVLLGYKPQQVLNEQANILSHFAQYQNPALSPSIRDENLNKAFNHLLRVTLDLHKMAVLEVDHRLARIFAGNPDAKYSFKLKRSEVMKEYKNFLDHCTEARYKEESLVGVSPLRTMICYNRAYNVGMDLYESFDEEIFNKINRLKQNQRARDIFLGFILGVIASVLGSYIFKWIEGGTGSFFGGNKTDNGTK